MPAGDRISREAGITLVEVMVALLIMGIVMSAFASVLITSLQAVRGQESTTQATAAINDILEEVQRVEYDEAVLCPTTATTVFGASTFDGEDLVLDSDVCGDPGRVRPEKTVTREGRQYKVRTAITWTDNPADGSGSSDADTPQDIKRVVVEVSWTEQGETRTSRNMGFRAPQLLEQLMTAEVVPDDGGKYIEINDDATEDGENDEDFTLRVHARDKLSSVSVEWVDRNGATEGPLPMTAKSSDGLVWEYQLHTNFGPFSNGGTLFQFEGTSTASETARVSARGLFLYDPMVALPGPTVLQGASESVIQTNFAKVKVSRVDGAACPEQSLWIDVEGAIRSDIVDATWLKSPTGSDDSLSSVVAPDDVALRGARFQLDLDGRTDFSAFDTTTGTYYLPNSTDQVRVRVNRVVDGDVIEKEQDGIPFELVDAC